MPTFVNVVGTVATDPKEIQLRAEGTMCTFRLASSERRLNRETQQWEDGTTNWFTVNLYRALAANAAVSFAKGDRVLVNGRLRVKQWQKDDRSGTSVEVDAEAVGHDLRWGTTAFTKISGKPQSEEVDTGTLGWSTPGVDSPSTSAAPTESRGESEVPQEEEASPPPF